MQQLVSLAPQCELKMTALELFSDMVNDEMVKIQAANYISQVLIVIHNFNINSNSYDSDYQFND